MKTILTIALLSLICGPRLALPQVDADTMARLLAGEILVVDMHSESAGGSARLQFLARSPARAVWDVIVSCEAAFTFVAGIRRCDVLDESAARARIHQVVKRSWLVPTQDYVFESRRDPYREIQFQLVEGSLRELEGSWRLTETAEGVLVDYRIRVAPAVPAPRFLVRWVIRRDMPDLAACVRGLAAGSGSEAGRLADLARCPGKAPDP